MSDKPVIWVTGANGQLGNEFRDIESAFKDYQFIFTSRAELSVEDPVAVEHFFASHTINYCINCAAYTAVDNAESDRLAAVSGNAIAPEFLASCALKYGAVFFHFSTDYVFNGEATTPYREDHPTDPINVYGETKRDGEVKVMKSNPSAIIIRTSWVYSCHGKNFVKTMLRLMKEKTEISVVNDQLGSPTYAGDLASVVMHIITCSKAAEMIPGIYHYSSRGVISWFEFAEAIRELSGSTCMVHPVPATSYPTPAKRPAYSVLDTEKIQRIFGVKIPFWKDSLKKCIALLLAS